MFNSYSLATANSCMLLMKLPSPMMLITGWLLTMATPMAAGNAQPMSACAGLNTIRCPDLGLSATGPV